MKLRSKMSKNRNIFRFHIILSKTRDLKNFIEDCDFIGFVHFFGIGFTRIYKSKKNLLRPGSLFSGVKVHGGKIQAKKII